MRLSELLAKIGVQPPAGAERIAVTGLTQDSRAVSSGDLFVAIRGRSADGHAYIAAGVSAGASAVVVEQAPAVDPGVPVIVVDDSRLALAKLARAFYRLDEAFARGLRVVGVTGTNGKTTTTYLLQSIVRAGGQECARLGSIDYDLVDRSLEAPATTPDSVTLSKHLASVHRRGVKWVVMEVSSHGLDQDRVAGIEFSAAVFTNLSGDHLDYHGDLERYGAAKARLFAGLGSDCWAVLNADDRSSERMMADSRARRVTYGLSSVADVSCRIERITAQGSDLELKMPRGTVGVHLNLTGRHNIYNALAAAAAAGTLGVGLEAIGTGLSGVSRVPGRLDRVEGGPGRPTVLVDYAHTDDALGNVLSGLRPLTQGRLICVFGCGGARDRTKRPRMARAAEQNADLILVTNDNPRDEPAEQIIEEIIAGFSNEVRGKVRVEPDRRMAIESAIEQARSDDVVLIAGKGHERYQLVGTKRLPFDDWEVAKQALQRRSGVCGVGK